VPDAEWKRCAALAKDLLPKVSHTQVPRSELETNATRHGLSLRQLQRLRKKLRADPRASTLARSTGGRPEWLNRLSDQVHEITIHVVSKHCYRRERRCKMHIVERVRSVCRRLGMERWLTTR
jgi:hypothetical protein